ncbi:dipeptidase 1-like isoform X1 [Vespa mandarinia]|uniref:dipeptidase 1-like isoform X1 n=3 Tax=Vespa mandarinia TaxID=7446 RepID=UPI001622E5B1|nr:dipeptidase 1-like isoform X1 [Vespa mandarinia]
MDNIIRYCSGRKLYVNMAASASILLVIIALSIGLQANKFKGSDVLDFVPLIDGHNDLPYNMYVKLNNLKEFPFKKLIINDPIWGKEVCPTCYTDLPRLKAGKVGGQFWVAYVSCKSQYKDAVQLTLRQIDMIKRFINLYPEHLELVKHARNIELVWRKDKIASMIGVEGGHSLDSNLAILRTYYELGVRYVSLTHICNTPWADTVIFNDGYVHNLTKFGESIVYEMNRLGMLIDLSHVSHNVMRQVLAISRAPVIFSHSSAFSLCNNYRNVPDDVLHLVKKNEGIVMVNFYSGFVNCNKSRNATMQDVVDHINYIRKIVGVNHIGIGADYDGVDKFPEGLEDVSKYPSLFESLYENRKGEQEWSKEDLGKLAGRNFIVVMTKAEIVRNAMSSHPPIEDIINVRDISQAQTNEGLKPGLCQTAKEWNQILYSNTVSETEPTDSNQ